MQACLWFYFAEGACGVFQHMNTPHVGHLSSLDLFRKLPVSISPDGSFAP